MGTTEAEKKKPSRGTATSKKATSKKAPAKKAAAKKTVTAKKTTKSKTAGKAAPTKGTSKTAKAPTKTTKKKSARKKVASKSKTSLEVQSNSAAAHESLGDKQPRDTRLLVVDDEIEILELLVPFLRRRGYTVSQAEDGDQALEKILTERPNVVLLDVMMPGLNGWEISQYVRDRPELDPVRIIMATGIGEEMNAATAPIYGADAYIDKPFRLDEVEKVIEDVVARTAVSRA